MIRNGDLQFGRGGPEKAFAVVATARLTGPPAAGDRAALADRLDAFECAGVAPIVGYGPAYFRRLPAGLSVLHLPRLLADCHRYALRDTPPPDDLLFLLRAADPVALAAAVAALAGPELLVTAARAVVWQGWPAPERATFQGVPGHRLTTVQAGDYFADGTVLQLARRTVGFAPTDAPAGPELAGRPHRDFLVPPRRHRAYPLLELA